MWRWDQQEPFGNNVPDENPSGLGTFDLPLRLPGQYFDKETNLHYKYFWDYDPGLGIYKQSDPIGLSGGLNTYSYVKGNPLLFKDARGLDNPGMGPYGPPWSFPDDEVEPSPSSNAGSSNLPEPRNSEKKPTCPSSGKDDCWTHENCSEHGGRFDERCGNGALRFRTCRYVSTCFPFIWATTVDRCHPTAGGIRQ